MLSKRFYITLNPTKKKDKLILEFLKANYSESETIKNILYLYASQGSNEVQLDTNSIGKVGDKTCLFDKSSTEKMQNDTKSNNNIEINDEIRNMF